MNLKDLLFDDVGLIHLANGPSVYSCEHVNERLVSLENWDILDKMSLLFCFWIRNLLMELVPKYSLYIVSGSEMFSSKNWCSLFSFKRI